jgi:DNA modification methylase
MDLMKLLQGNNIELLKQLPDNSVDAVVTDPPYGLGKEPDALAMLRDWLETGHHDVKGKGFMGKAWDAFVPQPQQWREIYRVLKPGGHVLAFAGTRTQDLMALGLRLAGFEIRDLVAWVYGSGFPKSLDVSKAIDKAAGAEREVIGEKTFADGSKARKTQMLGGNATFSDDVSRKTNLVVTAPATDAARQWQGWGTALKPALEPITVARKPLEGTVAENVLKWHTGAVNVDGCRIAALTGQRPSSTLATWESEKNLCNLCANLAARPAKLVTPATKGIFAGNPAAPTTSEKGENDRADTSKADTGCCAGLCQEGQATGQTAGSSLSIGVSGKIPKDQSQKATKFTTSTAMDSTTGLKTCNACGCLITDQGTNESTPALKNGTLNTPAEQGNAALGRWPSNFIHDGSEDVTELFPVTTSGALNAGHKRGSGKTSYDGGGGTVQRDYGGDSGSAARFFYCAKVSTSERNEGLDSLPDKEWKNDGAAVPQRDDRPFNPSKNNHPTVKPISLMRYLCRLITPPGGVVLDPWMGSGSTGKAAKLEGFDFIGMEMDKGYFDIACARTGYKETVEEWI